MSIPSINQKTIILKLPTHCLFQALYCNHASPSPYRDVFHPSNPTAPPKRRAMRQTCRGLRRCPRLLLTSPSLS